MLMPEQPFQGDGCYSVGYPNRRIAPTGAGSDGSESPASGTGSKGHPAGSGVGTLNTGSMESATFTECNWPRMGKKNSKNQMYVLLSHHGNVLRKENFLFHPVHSLKQSFLWLYLKPSNPPPTSGSSTACFGLHHNQLQAAQNRVSQTRWVKHHKWRSTGYTRKHKS